jgi:DNA-binding response OmpR family regulator
MSTQILVVDDDLPLCQTITEVLTTAGYTPLVAHTAEDGLRLAQTHKPPLILLDVMLPGNMGGWELCTRLRQFTAVPIIFMTALHDTANIVQGLNLGADDYITKPFQPAEFLARLAAHLRRHTGQTPNQLIFGNQELIINLSAHTVWANGTEIDLTPREFELLVTLAQRPGTVIRTHELLELAWGAGYGEVTDNIKPYIHYLRKKIEQDPAAPRWILTVRGVGYRFNAHSTPTGETK